MDTFSFHSYGKTGKELSDLVHRLQSSVNADSPLIKIPVIITEHNSHTASEWDTIPTTPDHPLEASRLASQILHVISSAKIHSHFVFKFSIMPSFSSYRDLAKNGLHWADFSQDPYDITDTTLSAESMRLLSKLKNQRSLVLSRVTSNDTTSSRSYVAANSGQDDFFYLHLVNDGNKRVSYTVDLSLWQAQVNQNTRVILESVGNEFRSEVSAILSVPLNRQLQFAIDVYSTHRIAIQKGVQNLRFVDSSLTCTARAGSRSSQVDCNSASLFAGRFCIYYQVNKS
jgi:hypothetical protein